MGITSSFYFHFPRFKFVCEASMIVLVLDVLNKWQYILVIQPTYFFEEDYLLPKYLLRIQNLYIYKKKKRNLLHDCYVGMVNP